MIRLLISTFCLSILVSGCSRITNAAPQQGENQSASSQVVGTKITKISRPTVAHSFNTQQQWSRLHQQINPVSRPVIRHPSENAVDKVKVKSGAPLRSLAQIPPVDPTLTREITPQLAAEEPPPAPQQQDKIGEPITTVKATTADEQLELAQARFMLNSKARKEVYTGSAESGDTAAEGSYMRPEDYKPLPKRGVNSMLTITLIGITVVFIALVVGYHLVLIVNSAGRR